MPTRRDQLQSYQFMMQRVISSLVAHETDPEQTPLRRGVGALFGGVMVAALVTAVFGVYGALTGVGGSSWRADGAIIVERETGAHYVFRDDALQPVLNYASARLISDSDAPQLHRVAGRSLEGIPRNVTVGIPGAPASLPSDRLAGTPWTLCSVPDTDIAGAPLLVTSLLVGDRLPGGAPLGERGLLVRGSDEDTVYLVWNSHRYRIVGKDPQVVIRSMFGVQRTILDVGSAWLNGLPAGQDIAPIAVSGEGTPSKAVPGRRVGDLVYHSMAGERQYYLVRQDGLAYLTELQAHIALGTNAGKPAQLPIGAINALSVSDALAPERGESAPPDAAPELMSVSATGQAVLCAHTDNASAPPTITSGGDATVVAAGMQTISETSTGTTLADRVWVPPGNVAVVRAVPSSTAGTGALNLVTDVGLRFPVPSEGVLRALGYQPSDATRMPASLVQRIPEGPTLDPAVAMAPAPVSGPDD